MFEGFEQYFNRFCQVSAEVQSAFIDENYSQVRHLTNQRHLLYPKALQSTAIQLSSLCDISLIQQDHWVFIKQEYSLTVQTHQAGEIAETFFNSIYCHLYRYQNLQDTHLFLNKSYYKYYPAKDTPTAYHSYKVSEGLFQTIFELLKDLDFNYDHLERDVGMVTAALQQRISPRFLGADKPVIEVLRSIFYRNKGAYIIGRLKVQGILVPFILPLLSVSGKIVIDALITNPNTVSIIFGFARSCFISDTFAPSQLVEFLKTLMPHKLEAELYSSLGFSNHSKTTLHRQLILQIKKAPDEMILWQKNTHQASTAFTLPSFHMVFMVMHDLPTATLAATKERFLQIARYPRIGRLTEIFEFQNYIFRQDIFSEEVLTRLTQQASSQVQLIGQDKILIKQMLAGRRIVPLDSFLEKSTSLVQSQIIKDYGLAIIQLAQHNIFLSDFALHNFGVSQHKKVIYLNYSHVHWFDELAAEDIAKAIDQNLRLVLQKYALVQNVFSEQYPQILDTSFWLDLQKKSQTSESQDVFAYNVKLRFNNKGVYSFQNE